MNIKSLFLIFCISIHVYSFSQTCGSKQTISNQQFIEIDDISKKLSIALTNENRNEIDSLNQILVNTFGNEAGKPDAIETYYNLTNLTTWLTLEETINLSRNLISKDSSVYNNLWMVAKGFAPKTNNPHSIFLRASAEVAVGLLKIASKETDFERKNRYTTWAINALDSLSTMQLPNGAFPFPDLRPYKDPVFSPIINNYLGSLGKDSTNALKNGWIINDNNTGEFKFDAGVIANAYYEAYRLTNKTKYKELAIKIADYMLNLKANTNYNYNTFVSLALTRAFQLTNDTSYLNRAIYNLRYGVLPGQTQSGRWIDGHNANSRYHNLMIYNIAPTISLIPENNPHQIEIENMYHKAVQNLVSYTETCGSATGFRWLTSIYKLEKTPLEKLNTLQIQDLLGKYINQSNSNGKYLDIQSLGEYIEILDKKTLSVSPNLNIPSINIEYLSENQCQVSINVIHPDQFLIEVFSVDGRKIQTISNEPLHTGNHTFDIKKSTLIQGHYILKVKGNSFDVSRLIFVN